MKFSMLPIVLDLASQNVIDDHEMPKEAALQDKAIELVTEAAENLKELVGVDQHTFEDRLANAHPDYIAALYQALSVLIDETEYNEIEIENDGQPTEYHEWQDFMGGDDQDHGQYDEPY